jgi:hypothetical protein
MLLLLRADYSGISVGKGTIGSVFRVRRPWSRVPTMIHTSRRFDVDARRARAWWFVCSRRSRKRRSRSVVRDAVLVYGCRYGRNGHGEAMGALMGGSYRP